MLNRYTTTSTASRISWLHWVVSRKKSLTSLSTNSRFATGRKPSSVPTVQRHDRQQIARAARREYVDQYEGDGRPHDRGNHQHREQGEDRERREQRAAVVDHAVRRENRHGHQRHHPRRVQQRLAQLRQVDPQPVHRRGHEQVQVLRQEKARQCGNDVGEHQDRDERQQHQAQQLAREQRTQLLDAPEVAQDHVQHPEHGQPKQRPHAHQQQQLSRAATRALLADPLQCGPPLGLEHAPQRRLRHGAPSPPPWPSTSANSRTWAPPVSFRNSSSRLASPARCCRRRSSTVPSATILPCWMMATRSHIASATSSVWVLMSTVPPRLTNWRKMSFSRRAALGSSPTMGSSTTMYSGRWINALEMISFWRIPWLYASTSSSFQLASSNTSSSSAIRRSTTSPSWPYRAATNRRNSAPVSLSYTNGRSGMNPSRCLAAIGLACTSSPPNDTRPSVGRRMPAIMRSVVVLPAPLGPRNPYSTPRETSSETSSTATKLP